MRVYDDMLTVPDRPTIVRALTVAERAPSVHNTQPWRWRFDGSRLHLYTDAGRLLSSADPHGRQLVISCGAMLDHARTAFADLGWHADPVRVPDPKRPEYLASIGFQPWADPPGDLRTRAHAIARRRTDRLPLRAPDHFDELVGELRASAAAYRVTVDVLDDSARPRLAAASRRFGTLRRLDLLYDTELDWWTEHSDDASGIPPATLASDTEFERVGVGRVFPAGPNTARRDSLVDRSRLLVLSTSKSSVAQWLRTGEALSAVLLRCTVADLATCALTNITELPAGQELLAELVGHAGVPQVMIRVGAPPSDADPIQPTPRRPLDEILTF